jgi:UDP-N-acetylglucosamine--N-acetylmuramyl-(pentapeptide) pyrophosphoryl-undecaprenol N-acetylglucosamine transferase
MNRYRVSYYAHHFGTGHLRHAQRVASTEMFDLQVASTGPRNINLLPGPLEYVELAPDVGNHGLQGGMRPGDYLHYAPVGEHIKQRFATLSHAWRRFDPDVIMVDVSVEVALFARLSGYRVAFRRMPGKRTDQAHRLAYSLADAMFGYFPSALEDPAHLEDFGNKSHYLGVPEPRNPLPDTERDLSPQGNGRRVVVQTSLASSIPLCDVVRVATASPGWSWDIVGAVDPDGTPLPKNVVVHGVVPDPAPLMRTANLIISSAGHNAVAAAAACRRPVLLIPENRPFEEQLAFARALKVRAGIALIETWSSPAHWPVVLEHAAQTDPEALAKTLFVGTVDYSQGLQALVQACATPVAS